MPGSRIVLCEICNEPGALSPETEKQVERLKGKYTPRYLCVACFLEETKKIKSLRIEPPSEGQQREMDEFRPDMN